MWNCWRVDSLRECTVTGWLGTRTGWSNTSYFSRNQRFLAENSVQILQLSANSPDINPVENVWTILKSFVQKKNPTNKQELIQHVQESQHKTLPSTREKLMSSIPICFRNASKTKGDSSKTNKSWRFRLKIHKSMFFFSAIEAISAEKSFSLVIFWTKVYEELLCVLRPCPCSWMKTNSFRRMMISI